MKLTGHSLPCLDLTVTWLGGSSVLQSGRVDNSFLKIHSPEFLILENIISRLIFKRAPGTGKCFSKWKISFSQSLATQICPKGAIAIICKSEIGFPLKWKYCCALRLHVSHDNATNLSKPQFYRNIIFSIEFKIRTQNQFFKKNSCQVYL